MRDSLFQETEVVLFAFGNLSTEDRSGSGWSERMNWEYKTFIVSKSGFTGSTSDEEALDRDLNEFARVGFELVSQFETEDQDGENSFVVFIFRRNLP
jgi:hypothetical protein